MLLGIASIFMLASMNATVRAQDLTGAGSTFINPIMTNWIAEYQKATGISVNYQSVGSGAGINNLIDHTVDFAGSDAPMNQGELDRAKADVIHIPAVIGAVCVAYNVNGIKSGLVFSPAALSGIFLGTIEYWDDALIVATNKGRGLPHEKIFTVHRSDGSGTTAIFTDYLSNVSSDWKTKVGQGKTVNWPNGLGGKGNQGVAGILSQHDNSIGYVELAYAVQNNISYAGIVNAKGKTSYPTVGTASAAAKGAKLPDNLCAMITNTSNPAGYPITGFSWLIVYKSSPKTPALRKFLKWVLTTGQKDCQGLYYASIPEDLKKREMKLIDSMN
jgi:phosphate transport system substrate-binding protein